MGAREAKRSCPAVSQISNLMVREGKLHFWVRKAAVRRESAGRLGELGQWKAAE